MDKSTLDVDLNSFPIWDPNPDLLNLGPITIRYYGVLFAAGLMLGYVLWRWQMLRAKHNPQITEKFLVWGVVAVLAGSRLGHCLFYEPEIYLRNPLKILYIWQGGLASHGATIGLILALFLYGRIYKFSVLEVLDRFAMPTCMGAIFVRIGNFLNSEIVGRVWTGPLAVRFPRYDALNQAGLETRVGHKLGFVAQSLPRHPSQLYEALGGLAVFLVLLLVDWRLNEKRPRGLLAGLFLLLYFSFRFAVEFVKEYQRFLKIVPDAQNRILWTEGTAELTMGQWLSVPFAALGLALVIYALVKRLPAAVKSPND
jgi:prolipoprotein diacylglyceryl transferase